VARAAVLQSVYRVLEQHAPLRAYLGHVLGATTVETGARIIGDSVRLQNLPLPIVILGFDSGDALLPQREAAEWTVEALIYASEIGQAAALLDLIEDACLGYRLTPTLPQPLTRLQPGRHQRLEPDTPLGRVIATRLALTAYWIQS